MNKCRAFRVIVDFEIDDRSGTEILLTRQADGTAWGIYAVSYTHLDVYKRQVFAAR